jgi:hypothetical protein
MMPIYEYNEGEHPGGFIGLRVSVSINGKVKQKYFRFKKNNHEYISLTEENKLRKQAEKLNNLWLKIQKQEQKKNKQNIDFYKHKRTSVYNTGIQGISARFIIDRKFRANRWIIYYYPAFRVQGAIDKKPYLKTFLIKKSFSDAWIDAVNYYCELKNINDISPFLEKMPDKNQFKTIRLAMNKAGHNIPTSKLP